MHILLAALVFILVFCTVLLLDQMRQQNKRRKSLRSRLVTNSSLGADEETSVQLMSGDNSQQAKDLMKLMRGMGVNVEERIAQLELRFARAGIDSKDGPVYYLFFQRVISIFIVLFGGYLLLTAQGESDVLLGVLAIAGGIFGPHLYLKNRIDKRAHILQRSFPDALDLLLICVESGLALDAALARICNELSRAHPEITKEFNKLRLELALLNDRPRALLNLGERTGLVAFRSLVVALIQSERFGTSLTDTLRVLSEDFRLMRLTKAEEKAARLPVLMTLPLILLLMPAFFLIIMGPAIVSFVRNGQEVTGKK